MYQNLFNQQTDNNKQIEDLTLNKISEWEQINLIYIYKF